jgi:hypothetical protein
VANYYGAFIITDSLKKIMGDGMQIVNKGSVTPLELPSYTPFALVIIAGATEPMSGRQFDKVTGDGKSVTGSGIVMSGMFPMPWSETYTVGNMITADDIFEVSEDKSSKKQGFATIESIIFMKTATDLDDVLNYYKVLCSQHGDKIPYHEDTATLPAGSQAAEGEIFDDKYDKFMAELGANYQSN